MATVLNIVLDGDGKFPQLANAKSRPVKELTVTSLDAGMKSGDPSVAFVVELVDGSYVFAETSLKLFLTAADALKARYGDPRQAPAGNV
jgi:hypothetical protein